MDTILCGGARWRVDRLRHRAVQVLMPLIVAALVAACGGNGKDGAAAVAPAITNQPASASVDVGQTATFSVTASGSDPLAYQWQRNGVDVTAATDASYTTPAVGAGDNGALYTVVVANAADSVTSSAATLTVNAAAAVAPSITGQPASQSVAVGGAATFSVTATGSAPLSYQWRRNGADIAGATGASYTLAAAALADSGAVFTVRLSNAGGEVVSADATLTVTPVAVAPAITTQPADQGVNAGQSASFTVVATGTAPLAYQWRRNGAGIAGAIAASYTTPATADADNGARFSVVVSNAATPAAVSSEATLSVSPLPIAPAITTQPASASVNVGASATFSVVATGSAPLAYQWRRDGNAIAGATAASYTTPATVAGDDGAAFSVVVSNGAGSVTSGNAVLTTLAVWTGIREDGAPGLSLDTLLAVATDPGGNLLIAGTASEAFGFDPAGLRSRGFVGKYSAAGTLLWAHKFPVPGNVGVPDLANAVGSDAAGNVYVAGRTQGSFAGETHAGGTTDIALLKYDPAGNLVWARLLGSLGEDVARGIAVDAAGNAVVVGESTGQLPLQPPVVGELFIAKYDTDGNRLWLHQWGSGGDGANRDSGRGVALDAAGNAYMTGYMPRAYAGTTSGGSGDGFVAKYDANGNQVWFSRIRGLGPDEANAIAVTNDGGTIYVTGRTNSDFDLADFPLQSGLCCGQPDAFIARLDGTGAIQWIHNLTSLALDGGTRFLDIATSVATDSTGSIAFIAGYTDGVMPGTTAKGARDLFVARYEGDGTRGWLQQYGASPPSTASGSNNLWDQAFGIARNAAGDLFVVGDTVGTWGTANPNTDRTDWFVIKVKPVDGTLY